MQAMIVRHLLITHNTAQTCCLAIAQYWLRTLIISCYGVGVCTINPLLPGWSGYDFKTTIPGPRGANHTTNYIIQLQVCQTCSLLFWTVWHSIRQPMHVTPEFVVIAFFMWDIPGCPKYSACWSDVFWCRWHRIVYINFSIMRQCLL